MLATPSKRAGPRIHGERGPCKTKAAPPGEGSRPLPFCGLSFRDLSFLREIRSGRLQRSPLLRRGSTTIEGWNELKPGFPSWTDCRKQLPRLSTGGAVGVQGIGTREAALHTSEEQALVPWLGLPPSVTVLMVSPSVWFIMFSDPGAFAVALGKELNKSDQNG